ncbi:unnamed protein product [Sphagnum balticum]
MNPLALPQPEQEQPTMNATEAEYFRSIGRLEAQVQALTTAVGELKTKLDGIDTRLDTLDRMANRWKGGFAVILTLGAVAGFIIDHVFRFFSPR